MLRSLLNKFIFVFIPYFIGAILYKKWPYRGVANRRGFKPSAQYVILEGGKHLTLTGDVKTIFTTHDVLLSVNNFSVSNEVGA